MWYLSHIDKHCDFKDKSKWMIKNKEKERGDKRKDGGILEQMGEGVKEKKDFQ